MTLWITITARTAITRIPGNQLQRAFNSDATGLEAVPQLLPSELKIAQRFNAGVKTKPFFQAPKWTTEILA